MLVGTRTPKKKKSLLKHARRLRRPTSRPFPVLVPVAFRDVSNRPRGGNVALAPPSRRPVIPERFQRKFCKADAIFGNFGT